MKKALGALISIFILGCLTPQTVLSKAMTLIQSTGEILELEINESDRFVDIMDLIQSYYDDGMTPRTSQEVSGERICFANGYDFEISRAGVTVRSKKQAWRDYQEPVSKDEKKQLSYIVTTLAYEPLWSIGTSYSSLNKAGKKIEHLHPYRFLMTVFTDEKLKAAVQAIRINGGMPWDRFIDGLTGSLKDEAARGNLHQFTSDFAKTIKIDRALILPALEHEKWTEFVNILIDKVPREIDPNLYDM